ncbi:MAG: hypothetical protein MJ252_05335 [archaeon]|nr:hypothetical protein [archaeon]
MACLPQDKIISEVIPYIQKIMPYEEDEVLLAISEELPNFKSFLDQKNLPQIFPLFQFLFGCEETVVRESAIEKMRNLIPDMDEDLVQKQLVPLIQSIANLEAFQWKVSALYMVRMCYAKAGKDKEKLRQLYFKLCDDETPIIKRTAAKEFGPLCLTIEKNYVYNDMIHYYKKFMLESDIVRVTILPSLVQLAKLSQNADLQRENLKFIVAASEDKSWRVRNTLSQLFPEIVSYLGTQINEVIPTLATLLNDSETEVKVSALKSLNQIISKIPAEKIQACIIPAIKNIGNEGSKDVKSNIGESLGPIAGIIGYNNFNNNLGVVMDTLMKDENADVRLGVAKSMFQIFISSDGNLLTSTNALLGTMQKDAKYRIRETVYETLAKLGAHYGMDLFKSTIEPLFFNYITDNVSSVRLAGINSLKFLIEKFGSTFIVNTLIPKLMSVLQQGKTSYLNRLCAINSLAVCGEFLEHKQLNEALLPILLKSLKDKIANVRFVTIKTLQKIYKNFDSNGKDKAVNAVKAMLNDEDADVKFYATKFMENLNK